jgi:hypothetical protein
MTAEKVPSTAFLEGITAFSKPMTAKIANRPPF